MLDGHSSLFRASSKGAVKSDTCPIRRKIRIIVDAFLKAGQMALHRPVALYRVQPEGSAGIQGEFQMWIMVCARLETSGVSRLKQPSRRQVANRDADTSRHQTGMRADQLIGQCRSSSVSGAFLCSRLVVHGPDPLLCGHATGGQLTYAACGHGHTENEALD